MTVNKREEDNKLIIQVEGRVDSTNAAQLEGELLELTVEAKAEVLLDFENLEFISSAGLRVLLKVRKAVSDLMIINVSKDVYDIFETTGFDQILDVKKALRKISVEGCEMIGKGANGEVYRLDQETIVKVFNQDNNLSVIERELAAAKQAFIAGIPTAISYDLVKVGDCYGTVYEMLDADILGTRIMNNLDKKDVYIDKFIEVAKQMHSTDIADLDFPNIKDIYYSRLEEAINIEKEEESNMLRRIIEAIPDRTTMLHGDFHPKNVMMQGEEIMLIDMGDMSMGHPIIEVANCYSVFVTQTSRMPERARFVLGVDSDVAQYMWERFVQMYFGEMPEQKKELLMGVCQLLMLFRAVIMSCGSSQERLQAVYAKAMPQLRENADKLIYLLGQVDALFTE